MAREAIALTLEVPEEAVEVVVTPQLTRSEARQLESLRDARRTASAAAASARQKAGEVAATLHAEGLPLRDIGVILGIS